jgi:capsule polysaccharide export protein KpsE/RkpR
MIRSKDEIGNARRRSSQNARIDSGSMQHIIIIFIIIIIIIITVYNSFIALNLRVSSGKFVRKIRIMERR